MGTEYTVSTVFSGVLRSQKIAGSAIPSVRSRITSFHVFHYLHSAFIMVSTIHFPCCLQSFFCYPLSTICILHFDPGFHKIALLYTFDPAPNSTTFSFLLSLCYFLFLFYTCFSLSFLRTLSIVPMLSFLLLFHNPYDPYELTIPFYCYSSFTLFDMK